MTKQPHDILRKSHRYSGKQQHLKSQHEHRKRKHQRLAGPGVGDANAVPAREDHRESLGLNRRWLVDTISFEGCHGGLREAHGGKVGYRGRDVVP